MLNRQWAVILVAIGLFIGFFGFFLGASLRPLTPEQITARSQAAKIEEESRHIREQDALNQENQRQIALTRAQCDKTPEEKAAEINARAIHDAKDAYVGVSVFKMLLSN